MQPLSVFVSSISEAVPGPFQVNGTNVTGSYALPFGDNAPLLLYVPLVNLPQSNANSPALSALTYRWTVPSGWTITDGTGTVYTSTGAARDIRSGYNTTAGNQIRVTPTPGAGGTISVQAVNNNCVNASAGPVNSISKLLSLTVTRPTPTLTIISDKSPSGGDFSLTCGDRSDYRFRSSASASPSGGVLDSYAFVFSGPITPSGTVNSSTPATNFTGATGDVLVTLTARYTRNGASTTIRAAGVRAAVQPLPQPLVSSSLPASNTPGQYPVLCSSGTATLTTSVAGATSYTWTATGGLGVGSPGTTTLTTSSTSVTVYPGSGNGQGSVRVTATNTTVASCTSPTSAPLNIAYGGPLPHNGTLRMHSDRFDYETNCPTGCAGICPGSNVTLTPLDPNPGTLLEAVWRVYRVDVQPAQLVATQSYTGSGANNSTLYFNAGTTVGYRYEAQLQERNACGLGPVSTYQLEIINCDGGYNPYFKAPDQPATESVAYPNPASSDLTLEQGGGPVRLYNAQGQPVRSQSAKPGQLHLDTRQLPSSLYFVELRDAKGKTIRKQVRI